MKTCLNCTERYLGCHSRCEKYKAEKIKTEQAHKRRDEYIENYNVMFNLSRR